MQNSGIMQSGQTQANMYNNQMIEPAALDELTNFENELSVAPQSMPDNYVYVWNKKLKKYTCLEEPHLYQNHQIDEETQNYFMKNLHKLPRINPYNKNKTLSILGAIVFTLLAIGALLLGIFITDTSWKTLFYFLMSVFIILAVLCLVYLLFASKKADNKRMKKRRRDLRDFLAINNKMTFHLRNRHWRPSPYCSYLIYMMNYYGDKGDYESGKTRLMMRSRQRAPEVNPVMMESTTSYQEKFKMAGRSRNTLDQSVQNKFNKLKSRIFKSRSKKNGNRRPQSPFQSKMVDNANALGSENSPSPESRKNKRIVQRVDPIPGKQLNLMNSGSNRSDSMKRNSIKRFQQSVLKERPIYGAIPSTNPMKVVRRPDEGSFRRNPSPSIVRRIASDFTNVGGDTPTNHATHSFVYPDGPRVLSSQKPVLQPQGSYLNPATPVRDQAGWRAQRRVVQPGKEESVVYRRAGNPPSMVGRGERSTNRAYPGTAPVIRVTPPMGVSQYKNPIRPREDSFLVDRSVDGLMSSVHNTSGVFLKPR